MRFYCPIAKVDSEQRMVFGYASTEAIDDQGEIVTRAAMSGALDDYMQFANIREMHQPSAVGVAKEATMDGKGLFLGAKIVDEGAWQKVVEGVYKGFSIGGRVTERDPQDRKNITGLRLTEISVVDRPANPEAVFDCWKRSSDDGGDALHKGDETMPDGSLGTLADTEAGRALAALAAPVQIWACGDDAHKHITKAEATGCIAKRGAGGDFFEPAVAARLAKKVEESGLPAAIIERLNPAIEPPAVIADPGVIVEKVVDAPAPDPVIAAGQAALALAEEALAKVIPDAAKPYSEIIAVWRATHAPTMAKSLYDVGRAAELLIALDWMKDGLELEAALEGDGNEQATKLQSIIIELCAFLNALVAEETAELIADTDLDEGAMAMAARLPVDIGSVLQKAGGERLVALFAAPPAIDIEAELRKAGARNSATDKQRIQKMHDLTGELGAECADMELAAAPGDLAKRDAENTELRKIVGDMAGAIERMAPVVERTAKLAEDIAKTPMPPQTIRPAGLTSVTKGADGGGTEAPVDVIAELAKMNPEDRTLALIKAAQRTPIRDERFPG